jgi:uncharacterized protein YjbI with pentapeptide repeats
MDSPLKYKRFVDTGSPNQANQNFQSFVFENLNFKELTNSISFFRSDFREVKVVSVSFFNNDFNRADFVNAYIEKSSFEQCSFGTDFTNTYFRQVNFIANLYNASDIYKCIFDACEFRSEVIKNTTLRSSRFTNCLIDNCDYQENSFNDLHYESCTIKNTSFAEMAAMNLSFDACNFDEVAIDPNNIGTYLIKNCKVTGVNFLYRGKQLNLSGDFIQDLRSLARYYYESGRYFEAINTDLISRSLADISGLNVELFKDILKHIAEDQHYLRKMDQLLRLTKAISFYYGSNVLGIEDSLIIVGLLLELNVDFMSTADKLEFWGNLYILRENIDESIINLNILSGFGVFDTSYVEIQIAEEDSIEFGIQLNHFFVAYLSEYGKNTEIPSYEIIGERRGSVIYEIVASTIGLYILASACKSIFAKAVEVKMEYNISKITLKLLEDGNVKQLNEWNEKVKVARRIQEKPSDELMTKAKKLSLLIKQFHIFPNAIAERVEKR